MWGEEDVLMKAGGLWRPEEGIGPPGVGVIGNCELPFVGVGN